MNDHTLPRPVRKRLRSQIEHSMFMHARSQGTIRMRGNKGSQSENSHEHMPGAGTELSHTHARWPHTSAIKGADFAGNGPMGANSRQSTNSGDHPMTDREPERVPRGCWFVPDTSGPGRGRRSLSRRYAGVMHHDLMRCQEVGGSPYGQHHPGVAS
jgi:hypothetical protein